MPATNLPGGATSYGFPIFPGSLYDVPQGNVWFVNNNRTQALQASGDGTSRDKAFVSIADALAKIATTNPTKGDMIVVGAGHTENVTASNTWSNSLVNTGAVAIPQGTRIVGEGIGSSRPTITFTAAGSTIAFASQDCSIENMVLTAPTGSVSVTAAITSTASGLIVRNNWFAAITGTASQFTTSVLLASGSNFAYILDNYAYAVAGSGAPTNWVATTGTVGPTNVYLQRNTAQLALSATTAGLIDVSSASGTAPTNWLISDNTFVNQIASATVCIKGVAGWTGTVCYNNFGGGVTTNMTTTAINTPASLMSFQNFCTSGGKWAIVGGGAGVQTS